MQKSPGRNNTVYETSDSKEKIFIELRSLKSMKNKQESANLALGMSHLNTVQQCS